MFRGNPIEIGLHYAGAGNDNGIPILANNSQSVTDHHGTTIKDLRMA